MKFIKILLKNFKVLFRTKTSLFTVILGPLLVIALIGFAFSSGAFEALIYDTLKFNRQEHLAQKIFGQIC